MRSGRSVFLLFALMLILPACSEKITSIADERIDLTIRTSIEGYSGISQAATFILTVTGTGIEEPIEEYLAYDNGVLTGSVLVPAGPRRTFRIEAFDKEGTLIYAGQSTADVSDGSTMELSIRLRPQVPMIKVSPIYQEKPQGDLLAMKVSVYNVPDLHYIDGLLDNHAAVTQRLLHADSVILSPSIADFSWLEWWDTDVSVHFQIGHRILGGRIVDDSGYAELFTAYYRTSIYEIPAETFAFYPTLLEMTDVEGIELPYENVYTETGVAVMYDPFERIVAHYPMGWGQGSEDYYWIEDISGHHLHGRAHGTAIYDYGVIGGARWFDGNSDYVEVDDDDLLDLGEELTVSLWFNINREVPEIATYSLLNKRDLDGPINYQLLIDDVSVSDGVTAVVFRYGTAPYNEYRVDIPDNRMTGWQHIVFSYRFGDPGSAVLFHYYMADEVEGVWDVGTGTAPAPITSGPLLMGKDNSEMPFYLYGVIDEVEIYDAAFSLEVIMRIYGQY